MIAKTGILGVTSLFELLGLEARKAGPQGKTLVGEQLGWTAILHERALLHRH